MSGALFKDNNTLGNMSILWQCEKAMCMGSLPRHSECHHFTPTGSFV